MQILLWSSGIFWYFVVGVVFISYLCYRFGEKTSATRLDDDDVGLACFGILLWPFVLGITLMAIIAKGIGSTVSILIVLMEGVFDGSSTGSSTKGRNSGL